MARAQRQKRLRFRVLQNGSPISDYEMTVIPSRWRRKIHLSASARDPLSLTLYPICERICVAEIRHGEVNFCREVPWSGIFSSQGEVQFSLSATDRAETRLKLDLGGYANLMWRDLRLLIAYQNEVLRTPVPATRMYHASFWSLWFHLPGEARTMAKAVLGSALLTAAVVTWLFGSRPHRARHLEDLAHEFTLPFIHERSLVTAPEALQHNLDRRDPVRGVIQYYRATAQMILGWPISHPHLIFDSSQKRFQAIQAERSKRQDQARKERENITRNAIKEGTRRLITLPTSRRAPVDQSAEQLKQLVHVMQQNFKESLVMRTRATLAYTNDPPYKWEDYSNPTYPTQLQQESTEEVAEKLARMNVFRGMVNKDWMYQEAAILAKKANIYQKRLEKYYDEGIVEQERRVIVSSQSALVSFLESHSGGLEEKLRDIRALNLVAGASQEQKREIVPVVGRIDSHALQKLLQGKRFELNLCYEMALRRDDALRGKMEWSWKVDLQGSPKNLQLESSQMRDPELTSCVRRQILSWRFPRPQGGAVVIRHSFIFQPQGG